MTTLRFLPQLLLIGLSLLGSCLATVTDIDNAFTVTGCPLGPIVYELSSGTSAAPADVETWTAPTATTSSGSIDAMYPTVLGTQTSFYNLNKDYPFTYIWMNTGGNQALCQFIVRVQHPGIFTIDSCPPSNLNVNQAVASWTTPIVTSTTAGSISTEVTHNSGDIFPVGDTTVSYTWTDAAGNYGRCEFTVTVLAANAITVESCNESAMEFMLPANYQTGGTAQVSWTEPTAKVTSTQVPLGASVTGSDSQYTSSPFTVSIASSYTVTYTWMDGSDTATCTISLNVVLPPVTVMDCVETPMEFMLSSEGSVLVTWTEPSATLTNDGSSLGATKTGSGSVLISPITVTTPTTYQIIYTWSDLAGYSTTCTITLDVIAAPDAPVTDAPGPTTGTVTVTAGDNATSSMSTAASTPCDPNPCMNGGVCTIDGVGFTCDCDGTGYDGDTCENDIEECLTDPCMNGGTCMETYGNYTCTCVDGWMGRNCETDVDECLDNSTCLNGGTCKNMDGGFECECAPGYDGTNCEIDINECASNPCQNGICKDLVNEYQCDCTDTGYEGIDCEIDINECQNKTDNCHPNATCTNNDGGFTCSCNAGFEGDDGVTCTGCMTGQYGIQCNATCTCVSGAVCNAVDGACTCTKVFVGQDCDKDNLAVEIKVSKTPDQILDGTDVLLTCMVNLPTGEIGNSITWTLPDGTTRTPGVDMPDMGQYKLPLTDVQPEKDSGDYTCTASTVLQTGETLEVMATETIDVKAPGRIITAPGEAMAELQQDVEFNCTVYGNTAPVITWYGLNGELLEDVVGKIEIEETVNSTLYKTSLLRILNIIRADNGTYICNATNTLTQSTDSEFDTGEYSLIVIERPEIALEAVTAVDSESIKVEWTVTFGGNLDVDNCIIGYKQYPSGSRLTTNTTDDRTMYTITGLSPYTDYLVDVTCENIVGASNNVVFGREVRTNQSAPGMPKKVRFSEEKPTSVVVMWDDPDVLNGPIAYFMVSLVSGNNQPIDRQTMGKQSSLLVDGLTPGTEYTVTVSAINEEYGNIYTGDPSEEDTFTTPDSPPTPPTNVEVINGEEVCTVSWSVPEDPNGVIIGYTILYTAVGRENSGGKTTGYDDVGGNIDQKEYTKKDLIAYSEYSFQVKAETSAGKGDAAVPNPDVKCITDPGAPDDNNPIVAPAPIPEEKPKSSTFRMTVNPASARNGPVGCYEVIVVYLEKDEDVPGGDPDVLYPQEDITDYDSSLKSRMPYTAMVLSGSDLTEDMVITVGDKQTTMCNDRDVTPSGRKRRELKERVAKNGPLKSEQSYTAFTRAFVPVGDNVEYSSSPLLEPAVQTAEPEGPTGGVIAVAIIIPILLIVVLVLLFFIWRRRENDKNQQDPLTRTDGGGEMKNLRGIDNPADIVSVPPTAVDRMEAEYLRKKANNNAIFQAEYKTIPESTGNVTKEASLNEINKEKNRYINIIAYDQTRVRLQQIDDVPGTDYINACYVDGYDHPAKFIASQGPRDDTVDDFWRMVWEQNSTCIVMLTKCFEHGKDKCAQYWPDSGSAVYGDLTVTMEDVVTCSDYVIRKISMAEKGDEEGIHARSVTQFHFLGWPDFGIPEYPYSMLAFLKRVRQMTYAKADKGNIVIHCSAGVGRTGTYILIDTMMQMMVKEKKVDIYNFIMKIRSQRNLLVQSIVQYIFIHRALVEEYKYGHTEVDLMNLTTYYLKLTKVDSETQKAGVDLEYKSVASQLVEKTEQDVGNKEANKEKNRLRQVVPFDRNRVKLERLIGVEHSDYINASFIDGYEQLRAYIATQGPLPNTVSDFWRMVWEEQCSTIVMLSKVNEKGQEVCHKYWPDEGESATESYLAIQHVKEDDQREYIVRDFQLSNTKGGGLRNIRMYHFQDWPEVGMPETGVGIIKLIGEAQKHQKAISKFPIIVHCSSGAGRTGVFCALAILLGRIQAEGVVDVFQTVRTLRQQRPHMVQDPTQYQFCYKAILNHLDSYDTYANYK